METSQSLETKKEELQKSAITAIRAKIEEFGTKKVSLGFFGFVDDFQNEICAVDKNRMYFKMERDFCDIESISLDESIQLLSALENLKTRQQLLKNAPRA